MGSKRIPVTSYLIIVVHRHVRSIQP